MEEPAGQDDETVILYPWQIPPGVDCPPVPRRHRRKLVYSAVLGVTAAGAALAGGYVVLATLFRWWLP